MVVCVSLSAPHLELPLRILLRVGRLLQVRFRQPVAALRPPAAPPARQRAPLLRLFVRLLAPASPRTKLVVGSRRGKTTAECQGGTAVSSTGHGHDGLRHVRDERPDRVRGVHHDTLHVLDGSSRLSLSGDFEFRE